jgi:choline kinase
MKHHESAEVKAVILAAGQSRRLRPHVKDTPKCLLPLDGETILSFHIKTLLQCGVSEVLVVVGYKRDQVEEYARRFRTETVKLVFNSQYRRTDNAYSVSLALERLGSARSCVIVDGDIVFDPALLKELASSDYVNALVADNSTRICAEDSKVMIKNGFVKAIGKGIDGNAVYASLIKLSGRFLDRFREEVCKPRYINTWYSEPLNEVLFSCPRDVHALLTNGRPRFDIDTYSEYLEAKRIVTEMKWAL